MKKTAVLLLAALSLTVTVDAQAKKKARSGKKMAASSAKTDYDQNFYNFTGYYDNGADEAARRMAQIRTYDSTYSFVNRQRYGANERTINQSTEGVMGKDDIRLNERGEYRNLNSNTGVPLPPNNGGR